MNNLTETIAVTAMIYLAVVALLWTIKIIRNKDHW